MQDDQIIRHLESVLPQGYEYNNPNSNQEGDREDKPRMTTVAIVSAILVSIAGTIIFCASLVYLIELYERFFPDSHKAWIEQRRRRRRRRRHHLDKNQDSYSQNLEPTPVQTSSEEEHNVIFHHNTDGDAIFTIHRDEDAPLSCVSSVTNSLAGYETEMEDEELVLCHVVGALEQIVEDEYRRGPSNDEEDDWCIQVDLSGEYDSVLYKDEEYSASSGVETDQKKDSHEPASSPVYKETLEGKATSVSDESSCPLSYISTEDDLGANEEKCKTYQTTQIENIPLEEREDLHSLDLQKTGELSSLDDRSRNNGEDERDTVVPTRAEELDEKRMEFKDATMVDSSPFELQEYIRDVYFIPNQANPVNENERSPSKQVLGLHLSDAMDAESYPRIIALTDNSPLKGRVFEGDYITAMNDKDTNGMSAETLLGIADSSCERVGNANIAKMTKLTVMSSKADGDEDSSSASSFEYMACCSAESTLDVHQEKGLQAMHNSSHQKATMEV